MPSQSIIPSILLDFITFHFYGFTEIITLTTEVWLCLKFNVINTLLKLYILVPKNSFFLLFEAVWELIGDDWTIILGLHRNYFVHIFGSRG